MQEPILGHGLCECGCGTATKAATYNNRRLGIVKGQLYRFATGHSRHNGPAEFWRRVPSHLGPDVCWPWPGPFHPAGYGNWGGAKVHRVMFEHFHGPIPDGHGVLHRCDNPPCCNPACLFTGTQGENVRDMVVKGRAPCSQPRLTPDQVVAIRRRYAAKEATMRALATEYEISPTHARCIIRRLKWAALA
jgi:hypothetical protein